MVFNITESPSKVFLSLHLLICDKNDGLDFESVDLGADWIEDIKGGGGAGGGGAGVKIDIGKGGGGGILFLNTPLEDSPGKSRD